MASLIEKLLTISKQANSSNEGITFALSDVVPIFVDAITGESDLQEDSTQHIDAVIQRLTEENGCIGFTFGETDTLAQTFTLSLTNDGDVQTVYVSSSFSDRDFWLCYYDRETQDYGINHLDDDFAIRLSTIVERFKDSYNLNEFIYHTSQWFTTLYFTASSKIADYAAYIKSKMNGLCEAAYTLFRSIVDCMSLGLSGVIDTIVNLYKSLKSAVSTQSYAIEFSSNVYTTSTSITGLLWTAITDIASLIGSFLMLIGNIVLKIIGGVITVAASVFRWVSNAVNTTARWTKNWDNDGFDDFAQYLFKITISKEGSSYRYQLTVLDDNGQWSTLIPQVTSHVVIKKWYDKTKEAQVYRSANHVVAFTGQYHEDTDTVEGVCTLLVYYSEPHIQEVMGVFPNMTWNETKVYPGSADTPSALGEIETDITPLQSTGDEGADSLNIAAGILRSYWRLYTHTWLQHHDIQSIPLPYDPGPQVTSYHSLMNFIIGMTVNRVRTHYDYKTFELIASLHGSELATTSILTGIRDDMLENFSTWLSDAFESEYVDEITNEHTHACAPSDAIHITMNQLPACSIMPPSYTRATLMVSIAISAAVVAFAAATAFIAARGIAKGIAKTRARMTANVESAWNALIEDPTNKSRMAAYQKAVTKNNIFATFFGGSKISRASYWSSNDDGNATRNLNSVTSIIGADKESMNINSSSSTEDLALSLENIKSILVG